MTLVEIQRLLNGTGSVTEVLETVDKLAQQQEEQKRLEAIRLMVRLFKEEDEIEKDQW